MPRGCLSFSILIVPFLPFISQMQTFANFPCSISLTSTFSFVYAIIKVVLPSQSQKPLCWTQKHSPLFHQFMRRGVNLSKPGDSSKPGRYRVQLRFKIHKLRRVGLFTIIALQSNEISKKNAEKIALMPLPGHENRSLTPIAMDRLFTKLYLVPLTPCAGGVALRCRNPPCTYFFLCAGN